MLKRIHDSTVAFWHEVVIDPFHTDKADWRPVFEIVKSWRLDKTTGIVVWDAVLVTVKSVNLEQADFLIFEQGFSEAQREAERLDRKYPPGQSVLPVAEPQPEEVSA